MNSMQSKQTKKMYFQKNGKSLSSHGVHWIKILILQVYSKFHVFYGLGMHSKDVKILQFKNYFVMIII